MDEVLIEQQKNYNDKQTSEAEEEDEEEEEEANDANRVQSPVIFHDPMSNSHYERPKKTTLQSLLQPDAHSPIPHQHLPSLPQLDNSTDDQFKKCISLPCIRQELAHNSTQISAQPTFNFKAIRTNHQNEPKLQQNVEPTEPDLVKFNHLKRQIIDLVNNTTASEPNCEKSSFTTTDMNKKLVEELDEKDRSLDKSMNKNISYLEDCLRRKTAKNEIISNFFKLKNLAIKDASLDPKSALIESKSDADCKKTLIKLSLRPIASSPQLVAKQPILSTAEFASNKKRLNLFSSIKSSVNRVNLTNGKATDEYEEESSDEEELDDDDEDDDDEEEEEEEDENNNNNNNENDDDDDYSMDEPVTKTAKQPSRTRDEKMSIVRKTNEEPRDYVRGRGRGKYLCEKCNVRTKKLSTMKKHLRTHVNYRPFMCTWCNVSFKTKGNLVKHTKTKGHLKKCSEYGMSPDDEEVRRITSRNIDNNLLNRQLEIEKKIKFK